jgi:hypothetical protein
MRRPRNNSESQQYQDMSSRRLSINWRSPDRGETWWKPWLSVIIKLFMAWLSRPLIIRLFPLNSLPWLSRISDTSENKPERFDSDNQINISRLISFLARDLNEKKLGIWTKKKGLLYWCFTYVILYFKCTIGFFIGEGSYNSHMSHGVFVTTWCVCLWGRDHHNDLFPSLDSIQISFFRTNQRHRNSSLLFLPRTPRLFYFISLKVSGSKTDQTPSLARN